MTEGTEPGLSQGEHILAHHSLFHLGFFLLIICWASGHDVPTERKFGFQISMIQVVEARLFSEGLHVLGQPPSPDKLGQYLEAYFGEGLSPEAIDVVSHSNGDSLEAIKAKLQRIYSQVFALNQLFNHSLPIGQQP